MTSIPLVSARLSRSGSLPSWRKGCFRKRNPTGREVPGQQLLLCLAIPAGCNSVNTPNSCQPGSLNGSKTQKQVERSKNWKLGQLRDGCGTATAPPSRSLDLPGLFQPQFQGQNSSSCTCRELSMGQTPVEPPLGHCGCRVLMGRVYLPL